VERLRSSWRHVIARPRRWPRRRSGWPASSSRTSRTWWTAGTEGRNAMTNTRRSSIEPSEQRCPVVIEHVRPAVEPGRHPAKRAVGDRLEVSATIFKEGHDTLAAIIQYRAAGQSGWREAPMRPIGNDRWAGDFVLDENARYRYTVAAWTDHFASWTEEMRRRIA